MSEDRPELPDRRGPPPEPLTGPVDAVIPRGSTVFGHWVTVHFDGACDRAPGGGLATYGFVVEGEGLDTEEEGLAVRPWTPTATNNVAEYVAATRALEYLRGRSYRGGVILIGDSQLVVRQMRGEYDVNSDHLKAYHAHLDLLVGQFTEVRWEWVPREENGRADALSKRALARERPIAEAERKTLRRLRAGGDGR